MDLLHNGSSWCIYCTAIQRPFFPHMGRCAAQRENYNQGEKDQKDQRDTYWNRTTGGTIGYSFQTEKTSIEWKCSTTPHPNRKQKKRFMLPGQVLEESESPHILGERPLVVKFGEETTTVRHL